MSSESSSSVDPQAVEHTKQQIRGLVEEITALSKQELAPSQYYAEFLKRVVEALAAVGGAVWVIGEGRQIQLAYQINLKRTMLDEQGEHQAHHAKLLAQVAQSGEGTLVPPHSGAGNKGGTGDEGVGANPTEMLLVLAPLTAEDNTEAVVEIFQRPTPQPATRRGYLRFLLQMCDLASQWLTSQKLRQLGSRESLWTQLDDFARLVHESLDVRYTSYVIANEAQRLVGCDRVTVAVRRGGKCLVESVSGQDAFDNRSNVVTLLGRLATQVVRMGEPLWYAGDTSDLPPQVEDAVHEYVDISHTKTICIVPISRTVVDQTRDLEMAPIGSVQDAPIVAAIIFEQIEEIRPRSELAPRIDLVCGHAARALSNAIDHNSVFLMPLWRMIGKSRVLVRARTLPKTIVVSILLVGICLAMSVVPYDFALKGSGVLQPVERRDLFVNIEGCVVEKVWVRAGDHVDANQTLILLRNTDLAKQYADLEGEMLSTSEQRDSVASDGQARGLNPNEKSRLRGQLAELDQKLTSLRSQLQLLDKKQEMLVVRSPIAGTVMTWDIERLLDRRPVTRGQKLLTVANRDGPWELEVFMPERRMGHVAQAASKLEDNQQLEITYIAETDPTKLHKGTVRKTDPTAHLHEEHGHVVSLFVNIDKTELNDPRTGASVTAKVHCGRRPVGYVLLHDLFEFVDSRIIFNL